MTSSDEKEMDPSEYRGQQQWLQLYGSEQPQMARMIKARLRRWESELETRGETVEQWAKEPVGDAASWYVIFWHDRPGQPLESKCRHADRCCRTIGSIPDEYVRHPTHHELARLDPCGACG
jgi:hypothetical protein